MQFITETSDLYSNVLFHFKEVLYNSD